MAVYAKSIHKQQTTSKAMKNMKIHYIILLIFILILILSVSCSKENDFIPPAEKTITVKIISDDQLAGRVTVDHTNEKQDLTFLLDDRNGLYEFGLKFTAGEKATINVDKSSDSQMVEIFSNGSLIKVSDSETITVNFDEL